VRPSAFQRAWLEKATIYLVYKPQSAIKAAGARCVSIRLDDTASMHDDRFDALVLLAWIVRTGLIVLNHSRSNPDEGAIVDMDRFGLEEVRWPVPNASLTLDHRDYDLNR
jgi:hypothetical protein